MKSVKKYITSKLVKENILVGPGGGLALGVAANQGAKMWARKHFLKKQLQKERAISELQDAYKSISEELKNVIADKQFTSKELESCYDQECVKLNRDKLNGIHTTISKLEELLTAVRIKIQDQNEEISNRYISRDYDRLNESLGATAAMWGAGTLIGGAMGASTGYSEAKKIAMRHRVREIYLTQTKKEFENATMKLNKKIESYKKASERCDSSNCIDDFYSKIENLENIILQLKSHYYNDIAEIEREFKYYDKMAKKIGEAELIAQLKKERDESEGN